MAIADRRASARGGRAEAEALAWASRYDRDFLRAWEACPRGDWLFMLTLALAAGAEESRIPDPVARGFEEVARTGAFGSADEVRRRIDGPALIRASLDAA